MRIGAQRAGRGAGRAAARSAARPSWSGSRSRSTEGSLAARRHRPPRPRRAASWPRSSSTDVELAEVLDRLGVRDPWVSLQARWARGGVRNALASRARGRARGRPSRPAGAHAAVPSGQGRSRRGRVRAAAGSSRRSASTVRGSSSTRAGSRSAAARVTADAAVHFSADGGFSVRARGEADLGALGRVADVPWSGLARIDATIGAAPYGNPHVVGSARVERLPLPRRRPRERHLGLPLRRLPAPPVRRRGDPRRVPLEGRGRGGSRTHARARRLVAVRGEGADPRPARRRHATGSRGRAGCATWSTATSRCPAPRRGPADARGRRVRGPARRRHDSTAAATTPAARRGASTRASRRALDARSCDAAPASRARAARGARCRRSRGTSTSRSRACRSPRSSSPAAAWSGSVAGTAALRGLVEQPARAVRRERRRGARRRASRSARCRSAARWRASGSS